MELRPESHNPSHEVLKLDLAKHILEIDGVVVGALIKSLRPPLDEKASGSRGKPRLMKPKTDI